MSRATFSRSLVAPFLLSCVFLVLCSSCGSARPAATFYNPLNAVDGAGPWLLSYEGNYYLTTTQWSAIRMWKSPTIAGLATVKPVTIWTDPSPDRCCNVWAPEFHLLSGPAGPRWYVYYTAGTDGTLDNQRTNVLESAGLDPLGPYSYKGRLFDPQHDSWAIDGSVLKMANGALYFLFSAFQGRDQSIFIAPMSNPWTISGPRVLLSTPTYPWEQSVAHVNEGPEALQHNGKTFIIYSASACWGPNYKLGILTYTGGDVLSTGSWIKSPQPLFARADANGVYAPGHNGFFTSPDGKEDWIVYHANSAATEGCTGVRTTRVQKFTWNTDGTPNFGNPLSLDTPITPPSGETGLSAVQAPAVYYTLVNKAGNQCLEGTGQPSNTALDVRLGACSLAANQQWSVSYLGNGYYHVQNRASGEALEVAGGPGAMQDGLHIDQASWAHNANQQWRFHAAGDGWLQIDARHSGKNVDAGTCGSGAATGIQQRSSLGSDCQQFRLQPPDGVQIVNANSGKPLVVEPAGTTDGVHVVLASGTAAVGEAWSFVHQANGYYQVRATRTGQCLDVAGNSAVAGAPSEQRTCGAGANQQWRIEPLNDGTFRLVARPGDLVLDVVNCHMADGTQLQEWSWLNNPCQRFRFVAP